MSDRRANELLARAAATRAQALRRIWVRDGGNSLAADIGLVATEAFYSANPWLNATYVVERLSGAYSLDTIRRRLEQMADRNTLDVYVVGGRKLYKARQESVEATIRALGGDETTGVSLKVAA